MPNLNTLIFVLTLVNAEMMNAKFQTFKIVCKENNLDPISRSVGPDHGEPSRHVKHVVEHGENIL